MVKIAGMDAMGEMGVAIGAALRECVAKLEGPATVVTEEWAIKERDIHVLRRKVSINLIISVQNTNYIVPMVGRSSRPVWGTLSACTCVWRLVLCEVTVFSQILVEKKSHFRTNCLTGPFMVLKLSLKNKL